jgi:hypothetical protein
MLLEVLPSEFGLKVTQRGKRENNGTLARKVGISDMVRTTAGGSYCRTKRKYYGMSRGNLSFFADGKVRRSRYKVGDMWRRDDPHTRLVTPFYPPC